MCERACMANPKDKYYTEYYRTITDFNNRNSAPFSNKDILDAISRFFVEEESEDHNLTMDTSYQ